MRVLRLALTVVALVAACIALALLGVPVQLVSLLATAGGAALVLRLMAEARGPRAPRPDRVAQQLDRPQRPGRPDR